MVAVLIALGAVALAMHEYSRAAYWRDKYLELRLDRMERAPTGGLRGQVVRFREFQGR